MRKACKLQTITVAGLIASAFAGFAPQAQANAIINGDFTQTTGTFATPGGALNTVKSDGVTADYTAGGGLSSWTIQDVGTAQGLAQLYFPGNQGSTTNDGWGVNQTSRFGSFAVYDPGNVHGTTPTGGIIPSTAPAGGNWIAADGAVGYQLAIYQTLTNLTAGQNYSVSFWYAAAQQAGFTGTTTEGWQVSLTNTAQITQVAANGTTIQDTPAQSGGGLAQGAFQAWAQQTFTFTASSATQVLTFLSLGTPSGQPPMDFLADVVLTPTATPEPASLAMFFGAMVPLGAFLRIRQKRARRNTALL